MIYAKFTLLRKEGEMLHFNFERIYLLKEHPYKEVHDFKTYANLKEFEEDYKEVLYHLYKYAALGISKSRILKEVENLYTNMPIFTLYEDVSKNEYELLKLDYPSIKDKQIKKIATKKIAKEIEKTKAKMKNLDAIQLSLF